MVGEFIRLVLITSNGWVRKEAIAPANPVDSMRNDEVSSMVIVLGIINYIPITIKNELEISTSHL